MVAVMGTVRVTVMAVVAGAVVVEVFVTVTLERNKS